MSNRRSSMCRSEQRRTGRVDTIAHAAGCEGMRHVAAIVPCLAIASLGAGLAARGRQSAPTSAASRTGTGLVLGTVIDADSGHPIAGAIVEIDEQILQDGKPVSGGQTIGLLMSRDPALGPVLLASSGTDSTSPHVVTDDDGQFVFRNLPAASYTFKVTETGYSGGGYEQLRPDGAAAAFELTDGQRIGGVALKIWKNGAIGGTVLDEAGEPVAGVLVRVLRRSAMGAQSALTPVGAGAVTDDRGMYRVSGLVPGDYLVAVVPTPISTAQVFMMTNARARPGAASDGGTQTGGQRGFADIRRGFAGISFGDLGGAPIPRGASAMAAASDADERPMGYQITYYPAVTSSTRATSAALSSGEEKTGIDVRLTPTAVFRVSGTVIDTDGTPSSGLALRLVPFGDDQGGDLSPDIVATASSDATGGFAFGSVPPGRYTLVAFRAGIALGRNALPAAGREPTAWARASVSVTDSNVTGLMISLRATLRVTGRLVFDGSARSPISPQDDASVSLRPIGAGGVACGTGRAGGAAPSLDGVFAIGACQPGRYSIVAPSFAGWVMKSAMADGHDASDVPIDLTGGDLTNFVLTFTD